MQSSSNLTYGAISPAPNTILTNAVLGEGVCPEKVEENPAPEAQLSLRSKGKKPGACFSSFPSPINTQQRAADRNHEKIRERRAPHGEKATHA